MADPKIAKLIGVKVAGANIDEQVTLKNLTRGGEITQKIAGADRTTIFNPAPNLQWQDGDFVQAEMNGRLKGYKREILKAAGTQISITASADTASPGVTL